jgi:HEAT repeat protein
MLHFLTDSEAQVRTTALTAFLYQPRLVLRNLPLFIHLLDDPSPEVRARAARAIRQTGERGREAIPALEKLLNDSEFQVRTAAAEALGAMTNSSLVVSGTREVTAPARSASSQQIAPE